MPEHLFPDVESHLIDTNLFIRFERHDTIGLLERAVTEHDIVLLVPQRVYEELTPESYPYDQPPIDDAIESGWVQVLDEVDRDTSAYPRLPVSDECSDAQSEPRSEQAGVKRTLLPKNRCTVAGLDDQPNVFVVARHT